MIFKYRDNISISLPGRLKTDNQHSIRILFEYSDISQLDVQTFNPNSLRNQCIVPYIQDVSNSALLRLRIRTHSHYIKKVKSQSKQLKMLNNAKF